MIFISEFLPNPIGSDRAEWVELENTGGETISLSGWTMQNAAGRKARLSGEIAPQSYRVFARSETGLTIRNTDEQITLITPTGFRVDTVSFRGSALEGKSFIRTAHGFALADPTPGAPNAAPTTLAEVTDIAQGAISGSLPPLADAGLIVGSGALIAAAVLIIILRHASLRNIFFPRY